MAEYFRFLRVYRTELLDAGFGKIIADPVRVEFFQGSRTYSVAVPVAPPITPAGRKRTLIIGGKKQELKGDGTLIEIIARTQQSDGAREYCEDQIDRVVTQLSALLSPDLFDHEVWRGSLSEGGKVMVGMWLKVVEPLSLETRQVQRDIENFRGALNSSPDLDVRFTLMSKLFTRALTLPPSEERFLWLWTVLEVFPMKGTSNIGPIGDYLGPVTGHSPAYVKKKLEIGRLYDGRCKLVHDGKIPFETADFGKVLKKLEAMNLTVIRSLGQLPYGGKLDEFLA